MSESENINKANKLLKELSDDIKTLPMPTGDDDFKDIVNKQYVYIDKTLFAKEILDSSEKVVLITRPRRWGKTLGMSMLKYFLGLEVNEQGKEVENNPNRVLFDNLAIAKTDKINEQGRHPVIFLTLRDVKGDSYEKIEKKLKENMAKVFWKFTYIDDAVKRNNLIINKPDSDRFNRILNEAADDSDLTSSIDLLSRLLTTYHGKKPFVLIDEYDVPLNNSYGTNYYNKTLSLIRGFFEAGIKNNLCMEKAVITGVFKIAKSGLWTGMNNSVDYSILSDRYAQYFGFTESEVETLFQKANIKDEIIKSAVREWYNGYNIGGLTMYNPWSIINFFSQLKIAPYWINTESAVGGERRLSTKAMITKQIHDEINLLIANFDKELLEITINPEVVFVTIKQEADSLWGLLLFGGYLSVESFTYDSRGRVVAQAKIPNREVLSIYNNSITVWVKKNLFVDEKDFKLLSKDFNLEDIDCLRTTINETLKFYGDRIVNENESIFHGLIQSLCLFKGNKHQVAAESRGKFGRIDSVFYPVAGKSDTIVIHEYKIIKDFKDEARLKAVLKNALWQIYQKIYTEVPLVNNKYFDGRCSSVELRAIVILCNPIKGAAKQFTCEIVTRNHSIAEMEELIKVFQADEKDQDQDQLDMIKSQIDSEVEKYVDAYTEASLRRKKRDSIEL